MGPKCNDKCPYEKGRHTQRAEGHGRRETEIGVMQSQTRSVWSHQRLEEARNSFSLRVLGGGGVRHSPEDPLDFAS